MARVVEAAYSRFAPSARLAPYVEHFWVLSAPGEPAPRREILIPSGRPILLLSFASPSVRIDPLTGARASSSNAVSGIITQPFVVEQFGEALYVGVQFSPYALAAFWPTERFVNQVLPIEQWLGKPADGRLMALLVSQGSQDARVEALDQFLQTLVGHIDSIQMAALEEAITCIDQANGQIRVEELAERSNMSYASFYRMFRSAVGIPPKRYLDIVRYYMFVGGLLNNRRSDTDALIASMMGYYDQAHASRDFKRFTGVTPQTLKRTLNGIALLMHHSSHSAV
jgi:AraC-like DNA-binding protein